MEVGLLLRQWLPMLHIEKPKWKLTCWCVMFKFVSLLTATIVIGKAISASIQHSLLCITLFRKPSFLLKCNWFFFLHSKYFPEHKLPDNVIATTDAKTALLGADYCLHAVPVQVRQSIPLFLYESQCMLYLD